MAMRIRKPAAVVIGVSAGLLLLLVALLWGVSATAQAQDWHPGETVLDAAYEQAHADMRQSEIGNYILDWVEEEGLEVSYNIYDCPSPDTYGYYSSNPFGVVLCYEGIYEDPLQLRRTLSHEYLHAMFDAQCPDASLEDGGWHEHARIHLWQTTLAYTSGWDDMGLYFARQDRHWESWPGTYYDWDTCSIRPPGWQF